MSITTYWQIPPEDFFFKLAPGNVHVWRAPLGDSPERASRFLPYLSDHEIIRAKRCRIPQPQYQFVITRGLLRTLLSRYVGVPPTELQFENQPQGKPMLVMPSAHPIQFNVSHARGMALIAMTHQHAVGIDVEWIDRKVEDRDIAERYFSKRESTYLLSLTPPERTQQFFSYWTCKEAYLKMEGQGIVGGLTGCELSIEPDQAKVELSLLDRQEQTESCSLYLIAAGSEHVGAIALAYPSAQVSYWDWQDDFLP